MNNRARAAQPDSDNGPSVSCPMVSLPGRFVALHATVGTWVAGVVGPQPTLAARWPPRDPCQPAASRTSREWQEATVAQAVDLQPDQLLGPLLHGIGDDPPPLAVAAGGERLSGSRE
jgi:hypothetical protein